MASTLLYHHTPRIHQAAPPHRTELVVDVWWWGPDKEPESGSNTCIEVRSSVACNAAQLLDDFRVTVNKSCSEKIEDDSIIKSNISHKRDFKKKLRDLLYNTKSSDNTKGSDKTANRNIKDNTDKKTVTAVIDDEENNIIESRFNEMFCLKVCGVDEFLLGDQPLLTYKYVRECVDRDRKPQLKLMPLQTLLKLHGSNLYHSLQLPSNTRSLCAYEGYSILSRTKHFFNQDVNKEVYVPDGKSHKVKDIDTCIVYDVPKCKDETSNMLVNSEQHATGSCAKAHEPVSCAIKDHILASNDMISQEDVSKFYGLKKRPLDNDSVRPCKKVKITENVLEVKNTVSAPICNPKVSQEKMIEKSSVSEILPITSAPKYSQELHSILSNCCYFNTRKHSRISSNHSHVQGSFSTPDLLSSLVNQSHTNEWKENIGLRNHTSDLSGCCKCCRKPDSSLKFNIWHPPHCSRPLKLKFSAMKFFQKQTCTSLTAAVGIFHGKQLLCEVKTVKLYNDVLVKSPDVVFPICLQDCPRATKICITIMSNYNNQSSMITSKPTILSIASRYLFDYEAKFIPNSPTTIFMNPATQLSTVENITEIEHLLFPIIPPR